MADDVTIPVGKGRIIISNSLKPAAIAGNYIILEAKSRPGPCNDKDCQPIYYPEIRISQLPEDSHRLFAGEGYMLAMDAAVFNAIDRDRQTVTLKRSLTGKISVRGLIL